MVTHTYNPRYSRQEDEKLEASPGKGNNTVSKTNTIKTKGLGHNSSGKVPIMLKALGSIPSTTKKRER
jgi:hypothetical protein